MRMPGFNAEVSLYPRGPKQSTAGSSSSDYRMEGGGAPVAAADRVVPQQVFDRVRCYLRCRISGGEGGFCFRTCFYET
ncbi:MAG TPA: hypothetical protein VNZ44_01105 [Pyrinomonadaceae bacterium]|nr:hypothetical protein [Pyrinomonadaceae bacterium]